MKGVAGCVAVRRLVQVVEGDVRSYPCTYIEVAQDFATQWLWAYNNDRPNMGIGGITSAQKLKNGRLNSTAAPR